MKWLSKTKVVGVLKNTYMATVLVVAGFMVFGLSVAVVFLRSTDALELPAPEQILEDPGLKSGDSPNGCRYSNTEGLVYFCGSVRNTRTSEAVQGVTVAVYEELPPSPSFLDPTALHSASGKWGGNLIHLFSSTSTNSVGHYEITGRQARNVFVAYFCGANELGAIKRLPSLSRMENLDVLVDCPDVYSYRKPPEQFQYVDREGFLECTGNYLGSLFGGSEDEFADLIESLTEELEEDEGDTGPDIDFETGMDVPSVGVSYSPAFLYQSSLAVLNYEYRYAPFSVVAEALHISDDDNNFLDFLLDNRVENLFGDAFDLAILAEYGNGIGLAVENQGAWRRKDCEMLYRPYEVVGYAYGVPRYFCNPSDMSDFLAHRYVNANEGEDNYLVLNHLPYLPPKGSDEAFARIDIRTSLRQIAKSHTAERRQLSVFNDSVAPPAVKNPGSVEALVDDPSEVDSVPLESLVSCNELRLRNTDPKAIAPSFGAGSLLRVPFAMEDQAKKLGFMEIEADYPVCIEDNGRVITKYEACVTNQELDVCMPSIYGGPTYGGASMTSWEWEDDSDSYNEKSDTGDNAAILREDYWNPTGTAAEKPYLTKVSVVNPGSKANATFGGYATLSYFTGALGGTNHYGLLNMPRFSNDFVFATEEDLDTVGFGETPDSSVVPSPNAILINPVVEDVGSDAVSYCTISGIWEAQFQHYKWITRELIFNKGGDLAELLDLEDNLLFTKLWSLLPNIFLGNVSHSSDANVATGTFYTADSIERDRLLSKKFYYEGFQESNDTNRGRDIFDSLRTIASGGREIDFSTVTVKNINQAYEYISENWSWLGYFLPSLLERSQEPQKSFGDRVDHPYTSAVNMYVYYPLSEVNFDNHFKTPREKFGSEGDETAIPITYEPNNWGNYGDGYPWKRIGPDHWGTSVENYNAAGGRCSTYTDEASIVGGEIVGSQEIGAGISRTCKTNDCEKVRYSVKVRCSVDKTRDRVRVNTLKRELGLPYSDPAFHIGVPDFYIKPLSCDIIEIYEDEVGDNQGSAWKQCAMSQKTDTWRSTDETAYERIRKDDWKHDAIHDCHERLNDIRDKESKAGVPPWEMTTEINISRGFTLHRCQVSRAGPYQEVLPIHYRTTTRITQNDSLSNTVLPTDTIASGAHDLSFAMSFPGVEKPRYAVYQDFDIAASKTPGVGITEDGGEEFVLGDSDVLAETDTYDPNAPGRLVGNEKVGSFTPTQGYPGQDLAGGIPEPIYYGVAAPAGVTSGTATESGINYHCNEPGVSIPGNPNPFTLNNCDVTDLINCWKCPIQPPRFCKGLLDQVDGIDSISISPEALQVIETTFSYENFEEMQDVYAQVEEETGVPCEIIAGIHYREGSNEIGSSLVDGGSLRPYKENGADPLNDARFAIIVGLVEGAMGLEPQPQNGTENILITDLETWVSGISTYNGGGNANCSEEAQNLGLTEYANCGPEYTGEDDAYVMSHATSDHVNMSIIYPLDKADVPGPCLDAAEAVYPGSIGIGGLRADAACFVVANCPYELGTTTPYLDDNCPPPIPEDRVGAMTIAKYIYDLGTGNLSL